ncbi:hypothetical protein [Enterovirga sp.]|uniref:hypothetical protein n=1 Tax=Enterovirga sp. TaxID=2026350 RepID=UPI002BE2CD76|nr:hypothetical protein [Enterovirga sp.]HMO29302.1 hypothetical protein [Enterovirga sp.]
MSLRQVVLALAAGIGLSTAAAAAPVSPPASMGIDSGLVHNVQHWQHHHHRRWDPHRRGWHHPHHRHWHHRDRHWHHHHGRPHHHHRRHGW